jgi:hypothetical protein
MLMLGLYSGAPSSGGVLLLDCSAFATSCTLTTNAHGYEGAAVAVQQALVDSFRLYDAPGLLYLGVSCYGQIVWEGRLEDPTLFAGEGGSGLTAQALGYWRALSDAPYIAAWSSASVSGFLQTVNEMSATYSESERWTRDTSNRLGIGLTVGTTYTLNKAGGLLFGIPHRSTRNIIGIQFALEINLPAAHTWRCVSFAGDISGALTAGAVEASLVGTAAVVNRAYHLILATPRETCGIDVLCNTAGAYAGQTWASYAKATRVRVVTSSANRINTSFTANRAAGAGVTATVGSTAGMYVGMDLVINSGAALSEMISVTSITSATQFVATFTNAYVIGNAVQGFRILADEIAEDMLASYINVLNPSQLSNSTGLIQSPGLDLLNESYEDADMASILTHLASLGDTTGNQWEVGVYEGQTLFFRPQGSGRAWYVDATDLSIVRTLEDLRNTARAAYKDASGRTLRTTAASDSASIARYGVLRADTIAADTSSAALAGVIRDTDLADLKDPKPRATIRFEAVYDASGARYPLWLVRADDLMTIRNLPPNISTSVDRIRTFYLTHTSYDAFADTLDVEPEVAPRTLEVMLARRSEGIRS